jgi:hypothetical protein
MFDNVAHPGLKALLAFEATRHQVPMEYRETDAFPPPSTPFVPRVEVLAYCGGEVGGLSIALPGGSTAYDGPLAAACGLLDEEIRVGDVLVGGITGNRIVLRLSLEALFHQADPPSDATLDPTTPTVNLAHQVFDAIMGKALSQAVQSVRAHDWRTEADTYTQMKLTIMDRSTREWREEIARNDRNIDEKTWEIMGLVTRNERLREALSGFQDATRMAHRRRAVEEHGEMVKMLGAGAIHNLHCNDGQVDFETDRVTIDYDDYDYVLGPFRVEMNLAESAVRITGLPGAPKVDGYYHPHVASGGTPCLGNMAPIIAKTMGAGDVVGAIGTVLEFLRSYNHGNGYVDLMRWNPDYEDDDDKHESCFDNSSCHDCVVCSDSDCPYRDGCEHRCWENHDRQDCIDCGDCGYRDTAIQQCREEHEDTPWACTECSSSCSYAGDISECHDSHNGGRCGDCPLTDCVRHPRDDKENDDATEAEAPAA